MSDEKPLGAAAATGDPVRGAPPTRRGIATREALIDGALKVFAAHHYNDATIAQICSTAGRSIGLFYRHFDNKQAIFAACAQRFFERLLDREPAREVADLDPGAAIDASIAAYWETVDDFYPVMGGLFEVGLQDPAINGVWQQIRSQAMRRFSARIVEQQKRGLCAGLDPALGASALLSMLEFSCFNWKSRRLDFPSRAVSDREAVATLSRLVRRALEID